MRDRAIRGHTTSRNLRRVARAILGAGTGVAALTAATLFAGAQAPDPEAARQKLEAGKRALTDHDRKSGELQSELARLKEDEALLKAQMVETAKLIQASEAQLSAIEQRRGELEEQERLVRGSLDEKKGSLSGLLAAMQRMGRNPPPVMITRREDALDMVRSAKLIAASAPELAAAANALATQLTELTRIMTSIKTEEEKLRTETRRLGEAQTRLASLMDMRKQTVVDRSGELARVRRETADIRQNVTDLAELITRLDKQVAERTRLGQYEKELADAEVRRSQKAALEPKTPPPMYTPPAQAPGQPPMIKPSLDVPPKSVTTTDVTTPAGIKPTPVAATPATPPAKPSITLAPSERMAMTTPGRLQPSVAFNDLKGRLPLPVQGRRVVNFGDKSQRGAFQGIALQTRFGAQVTSPTDGWVVYAGEFRSYGQILIINAGGGYHILLANMSQIDAVQNQFIIAGEPVGTMAPAPRGGAQRTGTDQDGAPVLYIEFKKDQRTIDPDPWFAPSAKKNASVITPNVIPPQFAPG